VELKHNISGENIVVATTHIFWNPKFEDVKIRQVMMLLHKIVRKNHVTVGLEFSKNSNLPFVVQEKFAGRNPDKLILCGDFNSTPSSAIYSLIRLGRINLDDWNPAEVAGRLSVVSASHDVRQAPCDLDSFRASQQNSSTTFPALPQL
jgi:mRNA deadenylase 3'-5' endonuclease subunit Ccr4